MEIIVVNRRCGRSWRLNIEPRRWISWAPYAGGAVLAVSFLLAAGFGIGRWTSAGSADSGVPVGVVQQWNRNFRLQSQQIAQTTDPKEKYNLSQKIRKIQEDSK